MKDYTKLIFVFIGIYAIGIFILGLIAYAIFPHFFPFTAYLLIALFLFLAFIEVKASIVQIYKPYALILEKYSFSGDERISVEILKPGFHFVCQRFGIYTFHYHFEEGHKVEAIFTEEHSVPIRAEVPFKDVIGTVNAEIIIKISDIIKFAYAHKNSRDEVMSGSEASLRHFFSHLKIDEANEKRGLVNLDVLFNHYDENKDGGKKKWSDTEFGKRLIAYGYEPINFKIISFEYPDDSRKAKEAPYIAEEEGKATITKAKANKESRILEGEGEGLYVRTRNKAIEESVQALINSGLSPADARQLLQSNEYHRALIAANKVVAINSGGSSNAATGAEIAAGISAYNDETQKKGGKK